MRRRGGADDEVGSAGQRVVHPRGHLLPDGGQRVVGAQGREERRDDVGEGRARCGDGEVLHPAGRDRGRRLAGRGGLGHEVPRDRQEGPPGGAEREPPVAPVEEVDAEVVLELAQLARQGRLGDVHRAGGRRDRAGVGDGQEVAEGAQLHGDASWAWEGCGSGIGQHGTVGCTLSADAGRCRDPVPTAPRGAPMPSTPVEQRRRLVTAIPGPGRRSCSAASSRPCPPASGTGAAGLHRARRRRHPRRRRRQLAHRPRLRHRRDHASATPRRGSCERRARSRSPTSPTPASWSRRTRSTSQVCEELDRAHPRRPREALGAVQLRRRGGRERGQGRPARHRPARPSSPSTTPTTAAPT